jgi:hypothetical protein
VGRDGCADGAKALDGAASARMAMGSFIVTLILSWR